MIPAYNEAENIERVVDDLIANYPQYDYVVINDGSRDDTLQICRRRGYHCIDMPINVGLADGVQTGMMYAYTHGYRYAVQFDGDGQHDARYLDALVAAIEGGTDLAIGSRFLEETDGFQSTMMRRIGKTWLSGFLKVFAGIRVTDPTSGFRACGRHAIDLFCESYPIDYPEPESIAAAAKCGLTIQEIPVVMHERQGGVSSINALASVYYMIKVSLAIIIACVAHRDKRS